MVFGMPNRSTTDLLVIGAGPAGLAAAVEAQRAGMNDILIVEKGPTHSTMIRTFYKEGKRVDARYAGQEAICFGLLCLRDGNRESFLQLMDHVIESNKLAVRYNTEIWSLRWLEAEQVFEAKTAAGAPVQARFVVIAIGKMGKPNQPDYWKTIPNSLKNNKSLLFDINTRPLDGAKVLVVGGGDSASEYAQMLSPKNDVTLAYRRSKFSKMNSVNEKLLNDLIASKKIRALLPADIEAIEDENGKPRVVFKPGTQGIAGSAGAEPGDEGKCRETFDAVLFGLGGMTPVEFLRTSGVKLDAKGEPVLTAAYETTVPRLYLVGDLLGKGKGGGSIIAGFNSATEATRDLLARYCGKVLAPELVSLDHLKF